MVAAERSVKGVDSLVRPAHASLLLLDMTDSLQPIDHLVRRSAKRAHSLFAGDLISDDSTQDLRRYAAPALPALRVSVG